MSGTVLKFPIGDYVLIRGTRVESRLAWQMVLVSSAAEMEDPQSRVYPTRSEAVAASRRLFSAPIVFDDDLDLLVDRAVK